MDKWVDPNNPHKYVRLRTDGSITQVKNGMALDVNGSPVLQDSAAAHFQLLNLSFDLKIETGIYDGLRYLV